jgi:hypothetical protein
MCDLQDSFTVDILPVIRIIHLICMKCNKQVFVGFPLLNFPYFFLQGYNVIQTTGIGQTFVATLYKPAAAVQDNSS